MGISACKINNNFAKGFLTNNPCVAEEPIYKCIGLGIMK